MPSMPQTAGRSLWWGASGVAGYPGTLAVPAPKPGVQSGGDHGMGRGQSSNNSPDFTLPSKYFVVVNDLMRPPVRIRSNNAIPVPAGNMYNMPGVSMRSRRTGGADQVAQPGVVQRWPDLLRRGRS
jgi:hypothetical protein